MNPIRQFLVGSLAGRLVGLRRRPLDGRDLASAEFRTSTQRLGVRLTNRVRRVFRHRWLRLADHHGPVDEPKS